MLDGGQDALLGSMIGSYRIARAVGGGGMGRVYKGVNPTLGSRVAIKVISAGGLQDPAAVERFFAEARALGLIRHQNIVNVLDLGWLPDGYPYIVMEYVDGVALSAVLRRPGGVGARHWVGFGLQVLDALAAAHAQGIVHRDLKPDNVMVTPAGHVKLLDFGLAKLRREGHTSHALTATGAILGTPLYMSPEQALAQPVDTRSDLYSVGVILYEGLTGRVPFSGDSAFAILKQHVEAPPTPPRVWRPDLPEALEMAILRTLAKNPAERPQSATELGAMLLQVVPYVPESSGSVSAAGTPYFSQPPSPAVFPALAGGSAAFSGVTSNAYVSQPSWPSSMQGTSTNPSLAGESSRHAPFSDNPPGTRGTHLGWFAVGVTGTVLLAVLGLAVAGAGFLAWQHFRSPPAQPSSSPQTSAPALAAMPSAPTSAPSGMASTPEPRDGPGPRSRSEAAPSSAPPKGPVQTPTPPTSQPQTATQPTNQPKPASTMAVSEADPRPRVLHVSIGKATVLDGTYPNDVLNSRLQSAQGAIHACYKKSVAEEADGAQGTLDMSLTITTEGQTRAVGTKGYTAVPTNLMTCTHRAFLAVTLPPPANAKSVRVSYVVKLWQDP